MLTTSSAKLIGDTYTKVGLRYNSDDNSYEYTYEQPSVLPDKL